jgi:8-oxo-dGTP pyrophosphatase MutT (NUDIX family)
VGIASIKAVLFDRDGRVLLCHNDRGDWELPGGRPDRDEDDGACLRREMREETGLEVEVGALVSAYRFEVLPGREVDIRAYGCRIAGPVAPLVLSEEHTELDFLSPEAIETIELPSGYRGAIALWRAQKPDAGPDSNPA